MRWFDCFAFGFFLLIVGAEKEDFQSYITEQTKGTAVTKYELLKQDDTIGHGTEAIPTENTCRHTVTAEFPRAVLFDTRSTQPNEEIQIIKAASDSTGYVVSKNVQKTLTSKPHPSVSRSHRDLKIPLRSKSEKTSTQAALESVLSDTSEPEVHLSAVAEKAPPWFHALHDDKNRRNANSVTLTSADAGLGVPILSASHPHVIDNPAALLNDKDDKLSQGKGITNLGKNAYLSGTMQSILQNDPAEDSRRGNVVTDVCLTCLKDGKAASTEKSAALHSVSPHASSDSEGTEGFALDLNQFTASSHNLHHQLAGEHKEIQSKEIRDQNATRLNFPERGKLIYKQRFLPFTVNKTVNNTFLSKFQSETLLSDTETFKFDSQFAAKISSASKTHLTKEQRGNFPGKTFVTKGLNLTTAEPLYIDEKPVENGKHEVFSNWNPQSKCKNSSRSHKNASHNLSINLKNQDISNAPVSNMSFTAEAPHSSCKSILPKGSTYNTASHPTGSTSVIEARGATASFSFLRPTAAAVKNQESHFLTASDDAFISILKSQTTSELNSQTKEPILTLFPKDLTIRLASLTERDLTEKWDFQAFMNQHRIVKQSSVGPPRTLQNIAMKEQQTSVFATKKVKLVKDFASSSQQDFSDELLTPMLTKLPRTKKLTRTPSKTIHQRGFDVSAESFTKYKSKLITDLQDIHNVESKNEQVTMAVAEKEDNNVLKTESNRSREVQKTEETLKLQDEEGSTEDKTLENKKEEVLGLDKAESANVEKIINSGAERNRNTDREAEKMEERAGKTSREERVTLRQDKDPRQGEVREEGDAKRKGVTKINTENFTQEVAEMQRKSLDEKGAEAGGKEQSSREDMKCNKETVKEDMTNVPLEHTTNWKEVNKEHTVENLSSCHSLIKELKATEHKGIHLSENTPQKGEITNKSFSYKVTSNHQLSHLSLKSQRPQQSVKTHPAEELYTRITMHLSTHTPEPLKQAATSTLNAEISLKKEVVFPVSATPKSSYTSGTSTSKFRGILDPRSSPQSIATKSANMLSVTTGYQSAFPRFTVNTSLDVSIIHSIADHRHKFNTTGLSARTVLHALNGSDRVEYISPSMNSARHQQMYNDSSTKPRAVAALSAVAHVSMGQSRPHRGQPAAGRSRSSSSSDATSGCSFKLSEQASHPDSLHTPADDNKQRLLQALMPPMSPTAEIDQHPARRMSSALNVRTSGGDSSPVTYGLKASEKKSLQANFDPKPTNSSSERAEPLLATAGERNQREEEEIMSYMVMSEINYPDKEKYEKISESPITNRSRLHATNSQIDLYDLSSADSKEGAKAADRYHQFMLEDSTHDAEKGSGEKLVKSDQTKTTAFIRSDILPKVTNIQTHDFLNMFTQTHDRLSSLDHTANDSTLPAPHIHLKSDPTVHIKYTQRTVDQTTPIKTNNFTSMATISDINSTNAPTGGYKPLLTTSEGVPVSKKSPLAVVEYKTQSNSHKPLSLKGLLTTSTPGKLTPTVKRTKTIETQSVQQPEHEIFQQATEPSQHDLPAKAAISRPIKEVEPGVRAGFLKMAHRAGRAHGQTSAVVERMRYSSFKDVKSALTTKSAVEAKHPPVESISRARKQDRAEHKEHTLLGKTSISQAIIRAVTDSVPPAGISPTEIINKTGCRTIGCAKSGGTTKTTSGAGVMDHTGEMYKVHSAFTEKDHFMVENTADTKPENQNWSFLSGRATQRVINLKVELSPVTSKSEHDRTSADDSGLKKVKRTSDKTVHLEGHRASQRAQPVTKTTQRGFHRETSRAQEATAGEASLSEPEAAAEKTTVKSTELTLLTERNTKTQLDRRAGKGRIFEAQNASRSPRAHAKEETARPESGSRLLPSELEFKSELNQKRRTSPHLYLPGVTEISDDLCGSGNYTAEMILKLGRAVEPGDAVPAGGNIRVVINLKTNNSQINLGVTSCCLSPTTQPDLTNSTCCLFSRLAAEPSGITLLPSALSASASFTISLFQMINYSVVYLHCDLSVCLRNHSDCERQCLQERSALLSRGPGSIVANLKNRISFGPMLKQVKNSTFPEEIDQSELDLVLVIVSLAVGLSLITVMLLLVWLAYRRRAVWLLRSAAPPRSCCGCPHPEGDLISP